ncbi:MAG: hypothetical protein MJ153_07850 [Clostridia bacterium]|nr:hypothetical protein [Clostridia bacterium]
MVNRNISSGLSYFVIHLIVEVACFFMLSRMNDDVQFLALVALAYDGFAFVPQAIIGSAKDLYPRLKVGLIGATLLLTGFVGFFTLGETQNRVIFWIMLVLLCLGNAAVHVEGAETTLHTGKGKMTGSALFVGGGSFGVCAGKLLADTTIHFGYIVALILLLFPLIYLTDKNVRGKELDQSCIGYDFARKDKSVRFVVIAAFLIVVVRSYIGYGIPTAWKKTVLQTVLLYVFMGTGKCLGGILIDKIGMYKTAMLSIIGALPFLICGNNLMEVSLIGIMLFSMTMAVTLGILVSVLPECPGGAFGITTIGLFVGTIPVFFFASKSFVINSLIIAAASIMCAVLANNVIRKNKTN